MKKIICPMYWDCGYENDIEDFEQKEKLRLFDAIEKKHPLFINCTKCERPFAFHTEDWRTQNSHCKNPNENIEKTSHTERELENKLKKYKVEIPQIYFEYLKSDNFKSELTIFKDEDYFKLYNLEELCEYVNIDNEKLLQIEQLKGYAKTILEVNDDFFTEKEKKEYEELSECITIGYRNTDYLFVNKGDNSLHIFYTDGGDTEKIKNIKLEDIVK